MQESVGVCSIFCLILKKKSAIPIISKMADASDYLSATALEMLKADMKAAHIFDSVVTNKFQTPTPNEYCREIIVASSINVLK